MPNPSADNPFHYGTPAEGDHFTGRRQELDALLTRMRNGVNVVVLSPAATARPRCCAPPRPAWPATAEAAVIDVNVLRATSLSGLVGLLTARAFQLPAGKWHRARQAVPEFLRRVRVNPVVTFDPAGTPGSDSTRPSPAGTPSPSWPTSTPPRRGDGQAARRPGARRVPGHHPARRVVAGRLQGSGRRASPCQPGTGGIETPSHGGVGHPRSRAALRDGATPVAGTPPEEEMIAYLQQRAAGAGKPLDDATAAHLLALAGPVPNDIQHLAFEAYEAGASRIDVAAVDRGMARAVAHDNVLYAENLARLSPGQARVVTALAADTPDEPYSAGFARSVGLASGSSVRKALQPLLHNEDVVEREGRLAVGDPFFAAWLRADDRA